MSEGGGGLKGHVASRGGGSPLTLAPQHGGHVLTVPIKIKKKNPRSLRSIGFYKLNSYQAT